MALVMFPLVAEAHTQGKQTNRILLHVNLGTIAFGAVATAGLYFFGGFILNLLPTSAPYSGFSTDMAILCATLVLGQLWSNFTNHEIAKERFGFLWYGVPLIILQSIVLVSFTGYTFFYGILPSSIVDWMGSVKLATLRNIIWFQFIAHAIRITFTLIDALRKQRNYLPNPST